MIEREGSGRTRTAIHRRGGKFVHKRLAMCVGWERRVRWDGMGWDGMEFTVGGWAGLGWVGGCAVQATDMFRRGACVSSGRHKCA